MVHIPSAEGTGDLSGTQTNRFVCDLTDKYRWLHVNKTLQCDIGIFDQEEAEVMKLSRDMKCPLTAKKWKALTVTVNVQESQHNAKPVL